MISSRKSLRGDVCRTSAAFGAPEDGESGFNASADNTTLSRFREPEPADEPDADFAAACERAAPFDLG
ncbi:MAG: hypothetical protein QM775_33740 [Pirellulales bacterium]